MLADTPDLRKDLVDMGDPTLDLGVSATGVLAFAFGGKEIRAFTEDDGAPWFVAADVCALLGHSDPSSAVRKLLDEDQWRVVSAGRADSDLAFRPGRGGANTITVVDESGLYGLILGSRVPGARAFRRWVTREVLPAIRHRGLYATPAVARELTGAVHCALAVLDASLVSSTARVEAADAAGTYRPTDAERDADMCEVRAQVDARERLRQVLDRLPDDVAADAAPVPLPGGAAALLARAAALRGRGQPVPARPVGGWAMVDVWAHRSSARGAR